MSAGKSIATTLERRSGSVSQTRHIKRSGSGTVLSSEETQTPFVRRPAGFAPPSSPREYGEALWTAKDIL